MYWYQKPSLPTCGMEAANRGYVAYNDGDCRLLLHAQLLDVLAAEATRGNIASRTLFSFIMYNAKHASSLSLPAVGMLARASAA
jgi:hypothetical protein